MNPELAFEALERKPGFRVMKGIQYLQVVVSQIVIVCFPQLVSLTLDLMTLTVVGCWLLTNS